MPGGRYRALTRSIRAVLGSGLAGGTRERCFGLSVTATYYSPALPASFRHRNVRKRSPTQKKAHWAAGDSIFSAQISSADARSRKSPSFQHLSICHLGLGSGGPHLFFRPAHALAGHLSHLLAILRRLKPTARAASVPPTWSPWILLCDDIPSSQPRCWRAAPG